jgi:5-(carboxyamino)imidazole ribonucleotide synthase
MTLSPARMTVPPGSTIGIIGGGQLGRMLGLAAVQLGYHCHIYAPEASGPAADIAARWVRGAYDDVDAMTAFAADVDVITYEFENIPVAPVTALGAVRRVHPDPRALAVAQDRAAEKAFVATLGGRTAPWCAVDDRAGLDAAITAIGTPAILKTRRFGYDGKGQARIMAPGDADAAWAAIGGQAAVLEGMVAFDHEYSIVAVRGADGAVMLWDAPENVHRDGILATSAVPAPAAVAAQLGEAGALVRAILDALDYVGVIAVEFFAGADGPLLNEIAPRVHNSGHWTIEGAITSQFENHIRAVCGLPLGATTLAAPRVTMHNLIGADADRWADILADPAAHLHLYGKREARPGRKMGHVTYLR